MGKVRRIKYSAVATLFIDKSEDSSVADISSGFFELKAEQPELTLWRTDDRELNETGCKAVTEAFITGLSMNIMYAHKRGYRDQQEHLRYILDELKRTTEMIVRLNQKSE